MRARLGYTTCVEIVERDDLEDANRGLGPYVKLPREFRNMEYFTLA